MLAKQRKSLIWYQLFGSKSDFSFSFAYSIFLDQAVALIP